MTTTVKEAKEAIVDNLHLVFEQPDPTERDIQIQRLWAPSSEATFIDPERIWHGHNEISACVADLQTRFSKWTFKELGKPHRVNPNYCMGLTVVGPVNVLPEHDGDIELRVARVRWSYGAPGEQPKVFGEDVATVVNGKIKMLVALIEPTGGSAP